MLSSDIPEKVKTVDEGIINSYLLAKRKPAENISVDESTFSTLQETRQETSPKPIQKDAVDEKAPVKVTKNTTNRSIQTPTIVKLEQVSGINEEDNLISQKNLNTTALPTSTIDLLHKDAYEAMLKQETESFNKLKSSPIIDTIGTLDTTERPKADQPSRVYCDDAGSKTIVTLSKLTGGNVQCKVLEIQSFIDKRLTKYIKQP